MIVRADFAHRRPAAEPPLSRSRSPAPPVSTRARTARAARSRIPIARTAFAQPPGVASRFQAVAAASPVGVGHHARQPAPRRSLPIVWRPGPGGQRAQEALFCFFLPWPRTAPFPRRDAAGQGRVGAVRRRRIRSRPAHRAPACSVRARRAPPGRLDVGLPPPPRRVLPGRGRAAGLPCAGRARPRAVPCRDMAIVLVAVLRARHPFPERPVAQLVPGGGVLACLHDPGPCPPRPSSGRCAVVGRLTPTSRHLQHAVVGEHVRPRWRLKASGCRFLCHLTTWGGGGGSDRLCISSRSDRKPPFKPGRTSFGRPAARACSWPPPGLLSTSGVSDVARLVHPCALCDVAASS